MSFFLSFHLTLLGPTGAHWLDDPPDLTCKDSTGQHAADDPRLSCEQQVGGSSPPPAPIIGGRRPAVRLSRLGRVEVQSPVGALGEGLLEGLAGGEPEDEGGLGGEFAVDIAG